MRLALLAALPLAASPLVAAPLSAQEASMVYRLGKDTVAIEQWTRTATAVNGEMVQRSGAAVTRVQYRLTLGRGGALTGGSLVRYLPDGTIAANGPKETRFSITADSIVREVVFADSTQRRAFAAKGAMINFPTFIYGPTELLAAARRGGMSVDSLPALGAAGGLGFTGIPTLATAGGETTTRLRGGAYAMVLKYDARDRLLSVDGSLTTNKAVATRGTGGLDIAALARTMKPTGALSGRADVRAAFGPGGMVVVDYGRPLVRERSVWGGTLIPLDSIWRAGANDATHLFTTRTLTFGDALVLAPGMYTLWIQHTASGTWLIVNKQTGQWGTQYNPANDLGRVALDLKPLADHVEEFTITLSALGPARGQIDFAWGDRVASVAFGVSVARP